MSLKRLRLLTAGVFAFLLGVPLTEEALARVGNVGDATGDFISTLIDASGGES